MASPNQTIYILGIAGTGTGALAGLLRAAGHKVSGVDSQAYPPMRDKLEEWGIEVRLGFDAAHLSPPPDLVIVGNVIRRNNVEATYAREHNLPSMSMPVAIAELAIGQRHSIVVTGTHGKTTTTALIAHLLRAAGRRPGYLVGGALVGERDSFALGEGPFVIEGDEYDTAYFDKGPKFLHYRANTLVITSLEFDHADIYADVEAIEAAFQKLIVGMAAGGLVVVWRGAHRACRLLQEHGQHLRVWAYDTQPAHAPPKPAPGAFPLLAASDVSTGPSGLTLTLSREICDPASVAHPADGDLPSPPRQVRVQLWGDFGAHNTLAAVAVGLSQGLTAEAIEGGLTSFRGVRRRLEERGQPHGRIVVDDFAHHPTAVSVTLDAARARYAGRRLVVFFEPRSATSRRNIFFAQYVAAFAKADVVVVANHERLAEVPPSERFDRTALCQALSERHCEAHAPGDPESLLALAQAISRPGDVLLILSNGDFNGLVDALLMANDWQEDSNGRS